MSRFESLATAPYISLATFRKSGAMVATPVWCAAHEKQLYLFSAGATGKVKRLRNSSRAQVAVCDYKGKLQDQWTDAAAYLLDDRREIAAALQALRQKYGWQMRLADMGAKLTGRFAKRVYIRVELDETTG